MDVRIHRCDQANADFLNLVRSLTAALSELNGEKDSFYTQFNTTESLTGALVAYADDLAVGCGGFRKMSDDSVEIKRMFVSPNRRGSGIGGAILIELERWANELGYTRALLETSKRLSNAVHLYEKSGYAIIENYGPYVGIEDSVCMQKEIGLGALSGH